MGQDVVAETSFVLVARGRQNEVGGEEGVECGVQRGFAGERPGCGVFAEISVWFETGALGLRVDADAIVEHSE